MNSDLQMNLFSNCGKNFVFWKSRQLEFKFYGCIWRKIFLQPANVCKTLFFHLICTSSQVVQESDNEASGADGGFHTAIAHPNSSLQDKLGEARSLKETINQLAF
jgi:hypothetical protein